MADHSLMPGEVPDFGPVPALNQYRDLGSATGQPVQIFAQATTLSFAGFIVTNVMAATIKRQFENAMLIVFTHDDRPHKTDILACNPWVNRVVLPKDGQRLPVEAFERDYAIKGAPQAMKMPGWYESRAHWTDFHLSSTMVHDLRIHALPNQARLKIPAKRVSELEHELTARGLSLQQDFVCLHYRNGASYPHGTASPHRDQDANLWGTVADRVQAELNLQVVRLGHKDLPPMPSRSGFVDLADASTMLQAFAVSRARFLLCSPSGPPALAMAFGVPVCCVNMTDVWWGWGPHCHGLTVRVDAPPGGFSMRQLIEHNQLHSNGLLALEAKRYVVRHRTADEICEAARHVNAIYAQARPAPDPAVAPPLRFEWPPRVERHPWELLNIE
jgi:putative glycosyltransferase (TIGR04372 family)